MVDMPEHGATRTRIARWEEKQQVNEYHQQGTSGVTSCFGVLQVDGKRIALSGSSFLYGSAWLEQHFSSKDEGAWKTSESEGASTVAGIKYRGTRCIVSNSNCKQRLSYLFFDMPLLLASAFSRSSCYVHFLLACKSRKWQESWKLYLIKEFM